jgi:hypothetical protein
VGVDFATDGFVGLGFFGAASVFAEVASDMSLDIVASAVTCGSDAEGVSRHAGDDAAGDDCDSSVADKSDVSEESDDSDAVAAAVAIAAMTKSSNSFGMCEAAEQHWVPSSVMATVCLPNRISA